MNVPILSKQIILSLFSKALDAVASSNMLSQAEFAPCIQQKESGCCSPTIQPRNWFLTPTVKKMDSLCAQTAVFVQRTCNRWSRCVRLFVYPIYNSIVF